MFVDGYLLTPAQIGLVLDHHAANFGAQAGDIPLEGDQLLLPFAKIRLEAGIVDAQQWLSLLDDVPLLDEDLLDDPPFQVLDHLQLARRYHLALADGHFIQLCPGGPDDGADKKQEAGPQQDSGTGGCRQQHGGGAVIHVLEMFGCRQDRI